MCLTKKRHIFLLYFLSFLIGLNSVPFSPFWRLFAFFFAFVSRLIFVSKDSAYVNVIIFSWKMLFFSVSKNVFPWEKEGNCESIDVKNGGGDRIDDNWQFETCFRRWQGQVRLESRLITLNNFTRFFIVKKSFFSCKNRFNWWTYNVMPVKRLKNERKEEETLKLREKKNSRKLFLLPKIEIRMSVSWWTI